MAYSAIGQGFLSDSLAAANFHGPGLFELDYMSPAYSLNWMQEQTSFIRCCRDTRMET